MTISFLRMMLLHIVLSAKGQLDGNRLETRNLHIFASLITEQRKVDGNLFNYKQYFTGIV